MWATDARFVRAFLLAAVLAMGLIGADDAMADTETTVTVTHRIEDDSRRATFTGPWSYSWNPAFSGSSAMRASRAGARASMRFDGTGVGIVAPTGPSGGIVAVRLDGSTVATVSLYAAEATSSALVWWSGDLAPGVHSLTVSATGSREPSSTGTLVELDGFEVAGSAKWPAARPVLQENDHLIHRLGTWRVRTSATASGKRALSAVTSGASMKVTFTGTGIAWIGRKSSSHGLAEVLLNGKRVAVVGGATGVPSENRVMWAAYGLSNKKHTVIVRALGKPVIEGGGKAVDVDGFVVDGKASFTSRPTPFSYPWKTYIVVDKSEYRLYWVKDKILVKTYPIAHGRKWTYTPHRAWRIDAKYHSSGIYGPRKMRMFKQVRTSRGYRYVFTRYAIHGTNNPASIGTMASAGCIRMYNRDVRDLFPRVPLGTMVVTRE